MSLLFLLSYGMAGCSGDDDSSIGNNERKEVSLTRSEQTQVGQCNGFAFRLFNALQGDKSMMVSPVSVVYALGMLNNGAAGETKAQINEVLGFNGDDADGVNAFCKKLLDEALTLDKKSKLMIANNIYVNKDYELQPAFVQKAREYYQASPEKLDFSNPSTLGHINRWASDHTEGIIKNVLDKIDPSMVSYLLNAIYFKGEWATPFDKSQTKKGRILWREEPGRHDELQAKVRLYRERRPSGPQDAIRQWCLFDDHSASTGREESVRHIRDHDG